MEKKLTYSEFQSALRAASKNPEEKLERLYYFYGDEDFLKEEAWRKIVSFLVPNHLRSFNLNLLYGAETSADLIINQASISPVNAKRRVVVVFDLHKLSAFSRDVLSSFLPKIPNSACLILLSPKISPPTKFHKSLEKAATMVEFPRLWENQTAGWITNRVKAKGIKIEGHAVRMLQNSVGNSLAELAAQIDKLLIYIGEKGEVASTDVEAVVGFSRTHNIFQLMDSIGERDTEKSLITLSNLILVGEKPGSIIFWLTEHLERLIQTKEFASGTGESLASFLRTKPFIASKCRKQERNFNLEQLEKGLILLYQADVELKSNLMPDKVLLELLTYNLCHL